MPDINQIRLGAYNRRIVESISPSDLVGAELLESGELVAIPKNVFDGFGGYILDGFGGYIQVIPDSRRSILILYAPYDGVLELFVTKMEVGTVTASLEINSVPVIGGSIASTTVLNTSVTTGDNVFVKGDLIELAYTATSADAEGFDFMLLFNRKTT